MIDPSTLQRLKEAANPEGKYPYAHTAMVSDLRELLLAYEHSQKNANRYLFIRDTKLTEMLTLFPTCETCDVGLDYAVDCALSSAMSVNTPPSP